MRARRNRSFKASLLSLLFVGLLVGSASGDTRGATGEWVSNGRAAMKVDRYEILRSPEEVGPLIRLKSDKKKAVQDWLAKTFKDENKVVALHMHLRNDSKQKRTLGFSTGIDQNGFIYLRGQDGSEVGTRTYFEDYDWNLTMGDSHGRPRFSPTTSMVDCPRRQN